MLQNSLDSASQMDTDLRHTAKAAKGKELEYSAKINPNQLPDLNPTEHACHFMEAKHLKNKEELKTTAIKAWQSTTREETQHLDQTSCCH